MRRGFDNNIARIWNWLATWPDGGAGGDLQVGSFSDGDHATARKYVLREQRRFEHVAILGKTGTGKTSLLRSLCGQDVASDHGFVFFDLHGDTTRYLIDLIAAEERIRGEDLASKLVLIDPADRIWSVGLNVLESADEQHRFVRVAEIVRILKRRWQLETLGARTEELLRNALLVLIDNGLTLLELVPLLTDRQFRTACLARAQPREARSYFEQRYNRVSEAYRIVIREAVLNKVTAYTADPHFRHLLGQQSSISWERVLDQGLWVVVTLEKGRLGEEAVTVGSLLLAGLKNALFARASHDLFTLYCDELHNLVAYDDALESLFAEARKFGVSVCSASQYLDQYPNVMRAALFAVGTQIFFQLSGLDAEEVSRALGGGRRLADTLRGLENGHLVIRSGTELPTRLVAPRLSEHPAGEQDLRGRSMQRWARERQLVEEEISVRLRAEAAAGKDLSDWE